METADSYIKQYNLLPHPEGGYYVQTYRSGEFIPQVGLPERFNDKRLFSTAIYFLLEKGNYSAFHKIKSDECWHFYAGQTLLIYELYADDQLKVTSLGNDINKGEVFQYVVPAGVWFASEPAPGTDFAFVGCTVAPGFDFDDFEMADVKNLMHTFPAHRKLIERFCR